MKIEPILKTTLAQDMPPGPQGQPGHKKGAEVVVASMINSRNLGRFTVVTPNPVFFYLNSAERHILETKTLIKKINQSNKEWHMYNDTDALPNDKFRNLNKDQLYIYIEKTILIPIFLFTAIEAFANQVIPKSATYSRVQMRWPFYVRMDREQIERYLSTGEKLSLILRNAYGKNIKGVHLWDSFRKIKRLRDELVHLKIQDQSSVVAYNDLFLRLIDTDFEKLFDDTKEIMKFFVPSYFS